MAHLVEGATYVFRFTKLDGSSRTMLATIVSMPIGSNHLYVEELLGDGKKEPKTIRRDSSLTAVRMNNVIPPAVATEIVSKAIEEVIASKCTKEEQMPVEALKTAQKYVVKSLGDGKWDVSIGGRSLGCCYNTQQVNKLISYHQQYNF